jgi:hypothetical protein
LGLFCTLLLPFWRRKSRDRTRCASEKQSGKKSDTCEPPKARRMKRDVHMIGIVEVETFFF